MRAAFYFPLPDIFCAPPAVRRIDASFIFCRLILKARRGFPPEALLAHAARGLQT
jgi:hypothetical protein